MSLMIALSSSAQVPDHHPAIQMRKYYADVYTGSSIISYESESIDSILVVVSEFIRPAQVISVYSYVDSPYKHRYNDFRMAQKERVEHPPDILRTCSSGLYLSVLPQEFVQSSYSDWLTRQYHFDLSGKYSGRYCSR